MFCICQTVAVFRGNSFLLKTKEHLQGIAVHVRRSLWSSDVTFQWEPYGPDYHDLKGYDRTRYHPWQVYVWYITYGTPTKGPGSTWQDLGGFVVVLVT